MSISAKAIQAILDDGHPVLILLPKAGKNVLDEVLKRISPQQETAKIKAPKTRKASGKRKAWTKNEILGLAILGDIGGRGSISRFARRTGRSDLSVRSRLSALSNPKVRSTTDVDKEVLNLVKSKPSEFQRLGKRALSILGVSV